MKLRMIPYGYKVVSGKVTPFDKEVIVIHRIFDEYIKGKGLKDIADELTTENIPIMEDMAVWSKNRIKRIITDKRYIGSDPIPFCFSSLFTLETVKTTFCICSEPPDLYLPFPAGSKEHR